MKPLTAIILVYNEEANIEFCLESVHGLCQDIIVLDSGSTDRTLEICRRYTDKIFIHPFTDSAAQWTWGLENLPVNSEWVLPMDADHVVSKDLRQDIIRALTDPSDEISGYYSRHQYLFWNVPIRGFKPYGLRLFRLARVSVDPSEHADYRFCVQGRTDRLKGTLYEYNRKELSIDFWIDKHQRFAERVAAEEVLRGIALREWAVRPRFWGTPDERIVWLKNLWYHMPLYVRPVLYFAYRYILRLGFLDGRVGFVYHFMQAFWYRMLIDVRIEAIRQRLRSGESSVDDLLHSVGEPGAQLRTRQTV